jgi:[protein-PII] uridylyltransferase
MHDTGKAVGARPHSEASAVFAQRAALRLQLSSEQRKSLILLVDHHVTMSNMAQQRNLDDPETIVEFGRIIRNQKNLDALMLLTLADGQGTSAEGWSDWKETLVWQLYHRTSQYLTDQAAFYEEQQIKRDALQTQVAGKLPADFAEEIEAHFEFMPDNYFRAFGVDEIVSHASSSGVSCSTSMWRTGRRSARSSAGSRTQKKDTAAPASARGMPRSCSPISPARFPSSR